MGAACCRVFVNPGVRRKITRDEIMIGRIAWGGDNESVPIKLLNKIQIWFHRTHRRGIGLEPGIRRGIRCEFRVDGIEAEPRTLTLADAPAPILFRAWDGTVRARRTAPVQREIAVHRAGTRFAHRLEADCAIEIRTIAPKYQYGPDPREVQA